jgi:hypothetical protein
LSALESGVAFLLSLPFYLTGPVGEAKMSHAEQIQSLCPLTNYPFPIGLIDPVQHETT